MTRRQLGIRFYLGMLRIALMLIMLGLFLRTSVSILFTLLIIIKKLNLIEAIKLKTNQYYHGIPKNMGSLQEARLVRGPLHLTKFQQALP